MPKTPPETATAPQPAQPIRKRTRQPRPVADLPPDALITWPEVQEIIPIDRTTAWRRRRKGTFVPPVRLPGSSRIYWRLSDVREWNRREVA